MNDWLRAKLFERRIVLVTGALDDAVAAETAAALMTLDAAADAPMELHVDSADGTLEAAFTIMDTIDALHATVRVLCRGRVGGPAIGIVAAAAHRTAFPTTQFRLGQPKTQFFGTPDQIAAQSRQQQDVLWRFHARLARVTGRPAEEIAEDMRRGRYLSAEEARAYGLIDDVVASGQ